MRPSLFCEERTLVLLLIFLGVFLLELVHGYADRVFDRLPFNLFKQGTDSYRDIGEQKQREGKGVFYLFAFCCADIVPFGDGGYQTERIDEQIEY